MKITIKSFSTVDGRNIYELRQNTGMYSITGVEHFGQSKEYFLKEKYPIHERVIEIFGLIISIKKAT